MNCSDAERWLHMNIKSFQRTLRLKSVSIYENEPRSDLWYEQCPVLTPNIKPFISIWFFGNIAIIFILALLGLELFISMIIFSADYLITPLRHHNTFFFQVPNAMTVPFYHMAIQEIQSTAGFWSQFVINKGRLNYISAGRRHLINNILNYLGPLVC